MSKVHVNDGVSNGSFLTWLEDQGMDKKQVVTEVLLSMALLTEVLLKDDGVEVEAHEHGVSYSIVVNKRAWSIEVSPVDVGAVMEEMREKLGVQLQ